MITRASFIARAITLAITLSARATADVPEATWAPPRRDEVRDRALAWLSGRAADAAVARARDAWSATDAERTDVIDAVMATLAGGEPRAAALLAAAAPTAAVDWLDDPDVEPWVRDAIRLWLGRRLARAARFDEALVHLGDLDVAAAIDPAALLFHRAACQHWLLDADGAIASLDRLLERPDDLPARYARLAPLMRADIAALEDESLDHVARRMRDVERRLALGRAGAATREVQDGVVASLDRMIDDLERRRQDQPSGAGGGAGQGGGGVPLEGSRIAGGRGAGEVRRRDLGADAAWGDLPPHARDEALQQIGREFPPHYREAIEQYFKRLATGGEEP